MTRSATRVGCPMYAVRRHIPGALSLVPLLQCSRSMLSSRLPVEAAVCKTSVGSEFQCIPGGRKRNMRLHLFHNTERGRLTRFHGRKPLPGILTSQSESSSQSRNCWFLKPSRCAACAFRDQPTTACCTCGFPLLWWNYWVFPSREWIRAGTGAVQRSRGCWAERCCSEEWRPCLSTM
jgi:hypothetical protein